MLFSRPPFLIPVATLSLLSLWGCAVSEPVPPVADRRPYEIQSPHGTRIDDYYWLRDDRRIDPAVLAHLAAENAYKDAMLARLRPFEDQLFQELVARRKPDESSVPYRSKRGYYYYDRFVKGTEYPIYARKKGTLTAPEEVTFDVNQMAAGHSYYQLAGQAFTTDEQRVAYAEDTVGRRQYTIRCKDLITGRLFPDVIHGCSASIAWAADNQHFFYVEKDPKTLLGVRVKRHKLGEDPADDPVVYEEKDHSFYMGLRRTRDDRFVLIELRSTVSNEVRYLPADRPLESFQTLLARRRDHLYGVAHIGDRWIIRTNLAAKNFRIVSVSDADAVDPTKWREVIAHDPKVLIQGMALFDEFLVVSERSGGLLRLRVHPWSGADGFFVDSDETAYQARLDVNAVQDTEWLRYRYTSMITPSTIYEVNMKTRERRLLKRTAVLGGFDSGNYKTERLWATARDGTSVPISVAYHKDVALDGTAPLFVRGYGSYGASSDPVFRIDYLSLLDRGVVTAIAHIRGGQEMGRDWYDLGKLLHKKNTFCDFIDVTEHLIAKGYGARDKVVASGGSAGGLLMGAIVNMRPELYRAILASVPFVDVVTTMLDESIPLTTNEFDEWGNPKEAKYYRYMLSYSPYDNVTAKVYPAMLVTTGLADSQVQYFEPAKWVAKLRATKKGDNPLLFHINMGAGHGGKSGRFRRLRETAMVFSFALDQVGITK